MKIIIPEHLVTEIINKDLSYIKGDQPQPQTEVGVGRIQTNGRQSTTDDYARQATQNNPLYYGLGYLREESTSEIASIDILDTLDQRGLKQVVNTLVHNFKTIPEDNKSEAIAIAMKFILSNINWNAFDPNYKQELISLIG